LREGRKKEGRRDGEKRGEYRTGRGFPTLKSKIHTTDMQTSSNWLQKQLPQLHTVATLAETVFIQLFIHMIFVLHKTYVRRMNK